MILRWSYYEVIRVLVICFGTNPIYLHLNGLRMFLKMFFSTPTSSTQALEINTDSQLQQVQQKPNGCIVVLLSYL